MVWGLWLGITICNTIKQGKFFSETEKYTGKMKHGKNQARLDISMISYK